MMMSLKKELKDRINDAARIAVLGIGSTLRGDDAAGIVAIDNLKKGLGKNKIAKRIKIFHGETAPENLTGEIKRFKPNHIILIDTLDAGKTPGNLLIFKSEDISEGTSFNTHKMPAKILIDYLVSSLNCKITVIGIQPESIEFGTPISKKAERSAIKISKILLGILTDEKR